MPETTRIPGRKLKTKVLAVLEAKEPDDAWSELENNSPLRLVNPLFTALLNPSPQVKWHAVSLFGRVGSLICARMGMERGRVLMRRFMWMLNDESGGIGWGVPESMGELMAWEENLAREYHSILFSFLQDSGGKDNYLEYAPLRSGAFWGTARLAQVRPEMTAKAGTRILWAAANETDAYILSAAVMALNHLGLRVDKETKDKLSADSREILFYWDEQLVKTSVASVSFGKGISLAPG